MEGKTSKTPGSISTKSTGSSRPIRPESRRSGANPTTTMPEISGSSRPSTITLPQETIERMIRLLKADADPSLILALMGAVPTPIPETEGGSLFTVTLSRDVLERMIRVLKPDADPSLVLALIGVDLAPPPTGTTDIPEQDNENASSIGEVRKNEPGEEVEQQLNATREDGEPTHEVVQPQEQEVVRAEVSLATDGGEGANTLGLEHPLPIDETNTESLVENVERVGIDSAVLSVKEWEQQLLITMESTEEAEQLFLTPEEVMENVAVRSSEDAEADKVVEKARIVEIRPTERADVTTDEKPEEREVVIITNEGTEAEQVPPREETARARAAPVHTYQ